MLKNGRVVAPAFHAEGVVCRDVTTTSVRVTWPKFTDKKYPVYAYRVCTAEVGGGFEVRRRFQGSQKYVEENVPNGATVRRLAVDG